MEKKNNKVGLIIIGVALLLIIAGIILWFLPKKEENKEKENPKEELVGAKKYAGTYTNGENGIVNIYAFTDEKFYYSIADGTSYLLGIAIVKDDKAEGKYDDSTFEKVGDVLTIKMNSEYFEYKGGTFNYEKEYTAEDCYKDNVGDPNYLKKGSSINGIYKNGKYQVTIIQTAEDEYITNFLQPTDDITYPFSYIFFKESDNKLITKNIYDEENFEECSIVINGNTLTITLKNDYIKEMTGDYTKESDVVLEEYLSDKFERY